MRIAVFFVLLIMAGCSLAPITQTFKSPPDEVLFLRAVDELSATNRITLLQQVPQDYPDSIWAVRAETIIADVLKLATCKTQLAAAATEKQQLAADLDRVKRENRQLEEKIGQLKKLLIELEQRPK
ncbi:MAG: hypothetical protein GQ578_02830 [Desulfuromonadaceae bacterium]|nr:hypothetical protein [Desulfuromonadaceae bacterium]